MVTHVRTTWLAPSAVVGRCQGRKRIAAGMSIEVVSGAKGLTAATQNVAGLVGRCGLRRMFKSGFSILALVVFRGATDVFNGDVGPPTTWVALVVGHGQRCIGLATGIPIKVSGFFFPRRGGSIFEATNFPVVGHVIWGNSCGDARVTGPFHSEKTVSAVVRIF